MGRLDFLVLVLSSAVCASPWTLTDPHKSFARFEPWDASWNGSLLRFRFKTYLEECLLLYQGSSGASDAFIIELSKGKLSVVSSLHHGREPRRVKLGDRLNDLKWHAVELERISSDAVNISLDGEGTKTVLSQEHPWKAAVTFLYVGGVPATALDRQSTVFPVVLKKKRFVGCLEGPTFRKNFRKLIREAILLDAKGLAKGCLDVCGGERRRCRNRGKCVNMFTTFECDCRQTAFEGPHCDHESLVLSLKSTDFVTYQVFPATTQQDRVQFRFKTSKSDGVVLDTSFASDALAVMLRSGAVHVIWNLGDLDLAVSTGTEAAYDDGTWHFVEIQRNVRRISITVDDQLHISKKFPGRFVGFDMRGGDGKITVGKGISRKEKRPGFDGCLQKLTVNGVDVLRGLKTGVDGYFFRGTPSWKCDGTRSGSSGRNSAQERQPFLVLNGLGTGDTRRFPLDPCAIDDEDCTGGGSGSGSGEEYSGGSGGERSGAGSGIGSGFSTKRPAVTSSPKAPKTVKNTGTPACSYDDEDCEGSGSEEDKTPVLTTQGSRAPNVVQEVESEGKERGQVPAIISVAIVGCLLMGFLVFIAVWCFKHGGKGYSLSHRKMSVTLQS